MDHILRSDLVPELSPGVEADLMLCLAKEVELYSKNLSGKRCLLCPFRTFDRMSRLREHLKHHCAKNMYLADRRSPQLSVVRAYYDYCVSSNVISTDNHATYNLLFNSAAYIADWNANCSESTKVHLKSCNRPVLLRVLTQSGPQYWVKQNTVGCFRHSRQLYYTPAFADLFCLCF